MGGVLGEPAIFQAHASCFLEFQIQISLCGWAACSESPPYHLSGSATEKLVTLTGRSTGRNQGLSMA